MSRPDEVNPERAPAHGPDAYELVYCGERKNHTHLRAVEDGRPCCKPYFKLEPEHAEPRLGREARHADLSELPAADHVVPGAGGAEGSPRRDVPAPGSAMNARVSSERMRAADAPG